MEGLLLKLSVLDADAENAVRVIGFFDALVSRRVGVEALVRNASSLAECPVGLHVPGRGLWLRADPRGVVNTSGRVPSGATERDGITCWLERQGTPLPLDEMVLERFAMAAGLMLNQPHGTLPELGDPALVELVLAESVGEVERSRALHLMGLTPTDRVRVLAVNAGPGPVEPVLAALAADHERHAPLGSARAVLVPGAHPVDGPRLPTGARVGVGPVTTAIEAPKGWRAASSALRFAPAPAESGDPVVYSENLGALVAVAERFAPEDIAGIADVDALDRLAGEPTGADLIGVLFALCATGSVRKAATAVYRHHSTVATRLAHAETVLGFGLDTPDGRFRLHLALLLRRLRDNGS